MGYLKLHKFAPPPPKLPLILSEELVSFQSFLLYFYQLILKNPSMI